MNVAAIIVTKGDQDIAIRQKVMPSLPDEWQVLVWDNGGEALYEGRDEGRYWNVSDLAVYGRYAAIEYTDAELIYVQDDDCIVSDPQALADTWEFERGRSEQFDPRYATHVVCNMPPEFRHDFYTEHALVGFGAVFHRDAPFRAFQKLAEAMAGAGGITQDEVFRRTCDIVFTALTPRVLVDVPHENLPYAYHYDRMYRQPTLQAERVRMLDLVTQLKED